MLFVLAGLIEIVLYFYIIQHTGAVLINFGFFISLFSGIAWGMLIFDEQHGAAVWGAVAVLLGALGMLGYETLKAAPERRCGKDGL